MIVVADTSVLYYLAVTGHLGLLRDIYAEVWIPDAVLKELTPMAHALALVTASNFIVVVPTTALARDARIDSHRGLQIGEREAMTLALAHPGSLLIIDDGRARAAAKRIGINFTGMLGVLSTAKGKGLVTFVYPIVNQVISEGYHIGQDVLNAYLKAHREL